jgi:hypothetical protein
MYAAVCLKSIWLDKHFTWQTLRSHRLAPIQKLAFWFGERFIERTAAFKVGGASINMEPQQKSFDGNSPVSFDFVSIDRNNKALGGIMLNCHEVACC